MTAAYARHKISLTVQLGTGSFGNSGFDQIKAFIYHCDPRTQSAIRDGDRDASPYFSSDGVCNLRCRAHSKDSDEVQNAVSGSASLPLLRSILLVQKWFGLTPTPIITALLGTEGGHICLNIDILLEIGSVFAIISCDFKLLQIASATCCDDVSVESGNAITYCTVIPSGCPRS